MFQTSTLAKALRAQQQAVTQPQQSQPQAATPAPASQAPSTPLQAAAGTSPLPEPKGGCKAATPDSNGKSPPPLAASMQQQQPPQSLQQMMSPGLQQMQQVLQQHILSPAQLQSLQQAILLSQGQQQVSPLSHSSTSLHVWGHKNILRRTSGNSIACG